MTLDEKNDFLRSLNEGQRVSFDIKEERGKSAAVDLKAI